VELTPDQQRAAAEILGNTAPELHHLLTGYAGSGKTTLVQHLVREWQKRGMSVVLAAPTNKAVGVLAEKAKAAGLTVHSCTIHQLLGLKAQTVADRIVFKREKGAKPCLADVVVVDECSMLGAELMENIRRYLPLSFVLFVGDPAQLPPVNEEASSSFSVTPRSHLETVVRQAAGNPILEVARAIRESQGKDLDWSWCKSAKAGSLGVFLPSDPGEWMRRGFTSETFDKDTDTFRYLAWTNKRVAQVNQRIRDWRYGERARLVPFVPGEFALLRAPVIRGKTTIFCTNDEAEVTGIARDTFIFSVPSVGDLDGWKIAIPSWRVTLEAPDGTRHDVHMPDGDGPVTRADDRLRQEAAIVRERWQHRFAFKQELASLQAIYAMTVHTSQGSTFRNAFIDIGDMRHRAASNPLEFQQMLYVAATRPSHTLILVGA
jgi:exodeoxyribonuclease-5